jgi:aerobic-type carbon monoxide dehydrogenase small subunit (CoxS/CutS family)
MDQPLATVQALEIQTTINGSPWAGAVPVEEVLLDFLRSRLGLTGAKRSCESQVCGACTVLVAGRPVSSCSYLAFEINGQPVTTVEGLAVDGKLDPLQEAFIRNVAAQCGYCTAGQLMSAKGLLLENPSPTYEEIAAWLSGNLCRCGCYPAIARSIAEVCRPDDPRGKEAHGR